MIIIIIM